MATALFGTSVPFVFDPTAPLDLDDELFSSIWLAMTDEQVEQFEDHPYLIESPTGTFSSYGQFSEPAKSPGDKQNYQYSAGGTRPSSSPSTGLLVATPTSTQHSDFDRNAVTGIYYPPSGLDSNSPTSENTSRSLDAEYVFVDNFAGQLSLSMADHDPPPASQGPPYLTQRSALGVHPNVPQWQSFGSIMDPGDGSVDRPPNFYYPVTGSADFARNDLTESTGTIFQEDPYGGINALDDGNTNAFAGTTSYGDLTGGLLNSSYIPHMTQPYVNEGVYGGLMHQDLSGVTRPPTLRPHDYTPVVPSQPIRQPARPVASTRQSSARARLQGTQSSIMTTLPSHPHPHLEHHAVTHDIRPALIAVPPVRRVASARAAEREDRQSRRGGRQKGESLRPEARTKSHLMRKTGACWRCVLQRDPCPDEGVPCRRCMKNSAKCGTFVLECDRTKLPDLTQDFLPPSMIVMHQKQAIEDCMNDQVLDWDRQNSIDINLTSGYGPALTWKVYEFKPRTPELLKQFQYLQDVSTGTTTRYTKYSPPLGILKVDTSDLDRFETYMERLLHEDHLWDFGWTCFEEETQIDDFQAQLLAYVCTFYTNTPDPDLKDLLSQILRMLILTYIMAHTLTISPETVYGVRDRLRHTTPPAHFPPHTSPRLANQQLKFFFSLLRERTYRNILSWLQQTLHSSGKKEGTWLPAFCVILSFAMVLEEAQRTLHIQADAKIVKKVMTPMQAETEAVNACERIDERFALLVGLFQYKYRDRRWGGAGGSFGPNTPQLRDPMANLFLGDVRELLEEKAAHLRTRRDVLLGSENQCKYTSRLVARFLLPFLSLAG